jgi:glycosyltransferase involved in cell wall biosynthesis
VHPILDLHGELECVLPVIHATEGLDIVWEGLTATLPAVQLVLPALRAMADRVDVRLHLVTDVVAPRYMNRFFERRTEEVISDWGIDVRLHQWSVETLTEVTGGCDIAIVPVDLTDPMAVGKPENRMRVFWRLGLPVVASASPANVRAASLAGVDELLVCSTGEEWDRALESLRTHPEDRLRIARAGQDTALNTYSEESLAQRWDRLFESL